MKLIRFDFVFFILILSISSICLCELFTAVIDIQKSLQQEQDLATALDEYVSKELERLSSVKRFSDALKSRAQWNSTSDLTHPVHAYLMLKRLGLDWQDYVKTKKEEVKTKFESQIENLSLPSTEDVDGAMDAIVRLQDTYAIPARLLSAGKLSQPQEPHPSESIMTADECFAIALFAYNKGDLYHAKDWFTVTLSLMGNSVATEQGLQRSKVLDYLAYVLYKQGHLQEALALTNELLALEPDHQRALNNREHFERQLAAERASGGPPRKGDTGLADQEEAIRHNAPHRDGWYASAEFQRYKRLCRGKLLPGDFEFSSRPLLCRHYRPHPYFYLAPIKEEVAHWRPLIVLWHGIIGQSDIDTVRELAEPRLRRATVQDPATGRLVTARYRISKSAWLQGVLHPTIRKLDRRIELMTGLTVASAEELQVVNYGLGGHYEPHYDFAHRREVNAFERAQGNRIATLLYYLSDVPAGGATVFTDLGVRLLPQKGSAAFWYNLRRSGEGELMTRHAACPVLHGSKWVMNKWFHERGQEFLRPCSLNQED